MRDSSITLKNAETVTSRELAKHLGVSFIEVVKALVAQGKYLLLNEQMNIRTALAVARQLGFVVKGNVICSPVPSGIEPKPNWTSFQVSVKRRRLRALYHFTPLDNLRGIIAVGAILSRRRMGEFGIEFVRNNWGNFEKERILGADYICLSITNQWPMLASMMIRSPLPPAVLVVDPNVIWYEGTCFSPKNSASHDIVVQ